MSIPNPSTPHFEHLFLKRNGLLSIALSLICICMMAVVHSENTYNDTGWIAFAIGFCTSLCLVFLLFVLIRIMSVIPKAKNAWMYGNYQDEYFNHLNHRAYKYAFNISVVVAAILGFGELSLLIPTWLIEHSASLIVITLFISYGVPILFWLREDNE
jgi:hypothetical protein